MANTSVIRLGGKTVALSVIGTAHTPVALTSNTNDQINYVSAMNVGSTSVAIRFSTIITDVPVFPIDGTPGDFVLPPLMEFPIVFACPPIGNKYTTYVMAIGSSASPTLVYVTAIADQT